MTVAICVEYSNIDPELTTEGRRDLVLTFRVRDLVLEVRGATFKMQGSRCNVQRPMSEVQDQRSRVSGIGGWGDPTLPVAH
jgi:hypothetical protein